MSSNRNEMDSRTSRDWARIFFPTVFWGLLALVAFFGFALPSVAQALAGDNEQWFRAGVIFLFFVLAPVANIIVSFLRKPTDPGEQ